MCSAGPCKSASTWFASVSRQEVRLRPPRPIISRTTRGGTPRSNRWRPPPSSSMTKGATAGIFRQDRAGRSREHHGHRVRAGPHLYRHQPIRAPYAPAKAIPEPASAGATQPHPTIDTATTGPIRLLPPLLTPHLRRTMAASLRTIKQHAETQTSGQAHSRGRSPAGPKAEHPPEPSADITGRFVPFPMSSSLLAYPRIIGARTRRPPGRQR